jgi:MIP family channel proteins
MSKQTKLLSEMLAEGIGTFVLIFIGTGAIMVNTITGGAITHLGICLVFGAIVTAIIYTIGHISGAHINPAVTLAFWSSNVFPKQKILPYILSQFSGGILASLLLRIILGDIANMGSIFPIDNNWIKALIVEIILTFILMFIVLGSGLDRRAPTGFGAIAVGLTVVAEATFMGPITGAGMNPVRSLAPAIIAHISKYQWLYVVGPIIGAQLAVWVYRQMSNNFHDFNSKEIV